VAAPVTEPDRFLNMAGGRAVGAATAANMKYLRACFAAAGMHSTKADQVVRALQRRGGVYSSWHLTVPDAVATQRRNFGFLLTLAGMHKDRASALVRTFALMGNGAGGPVITGLTIPASFKTPPA
jgi:hypothetical protein